MTRRILKYKIGGVPAEAAHGWLTPSLDAGALSPSYATGSPWVATTPLHYVTAGVTTNSVIHQPTDGIDIDITTTIAGNLMSQAYTITNRGGSTLTDLDFTDYFNFHPDGSATTPDANSGKAFYLAGPDQILIQGNPLDPDYIADGMMWGSLPSSVHSVGQLAVVLPWMWKRGH